MAGTREITDSSLEDKIMHVLSCRVVSTSQLAKELGVKRYILTGYLEAMKNQGKLAFYKVGKSNIYTVNGRNRKGQVGLAGIIIFLGLLGMGLLLSIPQFAAAAPSIGPVAMSPSNELWVGEGLRISANCTDTAAGNITFVYVLITSQSGYTIPAHNMTLQTDGEYVAAIEPLYLGRTDLYTAAVYCVNDLGENASTQALFTVSNFTLDVSPSTSTSSFLGDQLEIDLSAGRDGAPVTSGVTFDVSINGQTAVPKISPPYDPSKGWIIYLDSPSASGTYDIGLTANYGRASRTRIFTVSVSDPVQFTMTKPDKTLVNPNDEISFNVYASDRGNQIPLTSSDFQLAVGTTSATVEAITPVSNYFLISATLPALPAGTYALTAYLQHGNYTYTTSYAIGYAVVVSGKFTDESGGGVPATLKFSSGGIDRLTLYTDSNGAYSGTIAPGTYDIQALLQHTTFTLYGAQVNSFDDPIKHYYLSSVGIPGVSVGGAYVYEVSLPYNTASVEMKYDEKNVAVEGDLNVYQCDNWNTGKQICYDGWREVGATIDTVRNSAYLNTSVIATYAIGTLDQLSVNYNLNQQTFSIKDVVSIKGMVLDENRNPVPGATVYARIQEAGTSLKALSDLNGMFDIEAVSPSIEGTYTLRISADKPPYRSYNDTTTFTVVRSKQLTVVSPDTLQVSQGGKVSQSFGITNTGQTDLLNINVSLEGIPSYYYTIAGTIGKLAAGSSQQVNVQFDVPINATPSTTGVTVRADNGQVSSEKVFGFTVVEATGTSQPSAPATGEFWNIKLPPVSQDMLYLAAFAAVSFALAFALRRRRDSKGGDDDRNGMKASFSEVREFLDSKDPEVDAKTKVVGKSPFDKRDAIVDGTKPGDERIRRMVERIEGIYRKNRDTSS